jgi:hypothetical protein
MKDTKVFIDKKLIKTRCGDLNIPIISKDNAILYFERDDDYYTTFCLSSIDRGLIKSDGNYYYFSHNIVNRPGVYSKTPNSVHSYDIYQITDDLANKIMDEKVANFWEVYFNCHFNFGIHHISTRKDKYIQNYYYSSYKNEIGLFVPKDTSPYDFKVGTTIDEFLDESVKKYKKSGSILTENKLMIRNIKLEEILN